MESPTSTNMSGLTTKEMWQVIKRYFGEGHVPGSAPIRYNMHMCEMSPARSPNDEASKRYGIEISEDAMPLYSILGDTCPPPCTCFDMAGVVEHIDAWLETAPETFEDDYAITSGKNDTSIDEAGLYIMRDTLSWWVHWGGSLSPKDYWKQIYVAFAAIPDDVQLSPRDFLDGTYRFLGHSWADCREGLLGEGLAPDEVEFVEMCLWRQMLTQYFEKVIPTLYPLLRAKTTLMTQYRVLTGNTLGCAALMLAAEGAGGVGRDVGVTDRALEAAAIAQCMSMDMAKEALGILKGEKTETVAGDRAQLKRELRWVYVRCMQYLEEGPNAHILRRFASAGLHYVPMMDRYLERVRGNVRFPITGAKARILERFINRSALAPGSEWLNADGLAMSGVRVNGTGKSNGHQAHHQVASSETNGFTRQSKVETVVG
ncbi:hypothetical protein KVR01_005800 [Diaporthe batatas]|uniref:uncharacterized protein n=1 Tax=Diaporthe batatas TaxID=748121 RepID=UPI001D03F081|nr:uncharacterized protein KVR01_005800 [Diaporthe batatas]KAG8163882.1 hypothetical protein KVR01_005800 [Diaporthe batatas]